MTYPNFSAGQLVTHTDLNATLPQYKIKPLNQSKTNSTLVNDTDLWFAMVPNATYEWELLIRVAGNEAGDLRLAWTLPSGAAGFRLCFGPTAGLSDQSNSAGVWAYRGFGTNQIYGVPTSGNCAVYERGTVTNGTTGGNFQLQWAQGATNASATIVGSDSYLKFRRIA
jgi:hypothetical protein